MYQELPGIAYAGQVPIFTLTEDLPENAQIFGELRFSGNLDYDCTTEDLIKEITEEAKARGANAIKIKNYTPNQDLCPDIEAYLAYMDNIEDYKNKSYQIFYEPNQAVVHFYRRSLADLNTQFVKNKIYINEDSAIRLRNRSKATLIIESGKHSFRLEDEKNPIVMDLRAGKTYFIEVKYQNKTAKRSDYFTPEMNFVDPLVGIIEFESFNNRRAEGLIYTKEHIYAIPQLEEDTKLQDEITNKFQRKKDYSDQKVFEEFKYDLGNQLSYEQLDSLAKSDSLAKNDDSASNKDFFVQFYAGYNTSSFSFRDGYVKISPENFPTIEEDFQPSSIQHGIDLGMAFGTEKGYMLLDMWFLEGEGFDRGRDRVSGVSLGFGGRYAIVPNKNHYINWGMGIGANDLSRGIYRQGNLTATLRNRKWAFTPQLKYEYQIPKTKISLYTQLRYVGLFGNVSKHSGVRYEESNLGRHEDRTETTDFRFRSEVLEVDRNGRMNYGSRFDLSFGIMYNY